MSKFGFETTTILGKKSLPTGLQQLMPYYTVMNKCENIVVMKSTSAAKTSMLVVGIFTRLTFQLQDRNQLR